MPASTCHPQQAINHIPSMNEPHITVTLTILDTITSHIIGHAGMGLCQIHNFSHVKVAVSSHVSLSASHAVTIQGSPCEVGDAIIAIRHQITKHHIQPWALAATPAPSGSSMPWTVPCTSIMTTPTPTLMQITLAPTMVPSVSSTPTPLTPMEIGALQYPVEAPRQRQTARVPQGQGGPLVDRLKFC